MYIKIYVNKVNETTYFFFILVAVAVQLFCGKYSNEGCCSDYMLIILNLQQKSL